MHFITSWDVLLLFFCTAAGVVSLFTAFLVKVLDYEDSKKAKGRYVIKWTFPPKEDRVARRERWGKVIGCVSKPVVPLVQPKPCDLSVDEVIEEFEKCQSLIDRTAFACLPNADEASVVDIPVEEREKERQKEMVRQRILDVLLRVGPPRRLCPISENMGTQPIHSTQEVGTNAVVTSGAIGTVSTPAVAKEVDKKCIHNDVQRLLMQSEEVVTVKSTGVSREILWAALARLDGNGTSSCRSESAINCGRLATSEDRKWRNGDIVNGMLCAV